MPKKREPQESKPVIEDDWVDDHEVVEQVLESQDEIKPSIADEYAGKPINKVPGKKRKFIR